MNWSVFFRTGRMGIFLRYIKRWGLLYIFMIAMVAFTALPLVYMVNHSLKPMDELFLFPPRYFVSKPTLINYYSMIMIFGSMTVPFTRYFFNSVIISVVSVTLSVFVSSMGAFALVKYKLPFVGFLFQLVVMALMFSPHVTAIPSYIVINGLGMVNTYWALILPKIASAYGFFLVKQFAEQLPDEILESARMDGASEWHLFWRIVMPMLKPAWSTLVMISFVQVWNDSFSVMVYITKESMKTLPIAIQTINGGGIARAGVVAAATVVTTVPTIIVYVVMQRRVMETMAYSGIKS